ncbi:hypothetical protein [Paenibacillus sp. YAF4_2]|uniref:hypothetical protein n=1 Tax=Paenibacillus sp. YAF4_2 TaxID=3233085 RepID=UPI003F955459
MYDNLASEWEIGNGRNREVYELSNNSVIKIALSKRGIENNKTEVKIYKYASKKIRKHLGHIKKYASKYKWIEMKKYKLNFRKTKMNLRRLKRLKKKFRKHGIKALDILNKHNKVHSRNLAIVNKKRIVVIDYGKFKLLRKG